VKCAGVSDSEVLRVRRFFTPDTTQGVVRLAALQQAAVFAQFGEESQKTEQQPVCSSLVLLLLDLKDRKWVKDALLVSLGLHGAWPWTV